MSLTQPENSQAADAARFRWILKRVTNIELVENVGGDLERFLISCTREDIDREMAGSSPTPDATGPTCYLEVEVGESRRRYVTIEVAPEMAERICEWTMKHNPTAAEEQAAIDAVKSAKVIKEEIIHDTYEIWGVDFPQNPQS